MAYEFGSDGGVVKFTFPEDKRPDTNEDILSMGFITPSFDAVLARVDSNPDASNDFLQLELVSSNLVGFLPLFIIRLSLSLSLFKIGGKIFLNYNLGSKDITIGDITTKVNDGKYHVVRFTRKGANSTLQIDDNPVQYKFPLGKERRRDTL